MINTYTCPHCGTVLETIDDNTIRYQVVSFETAQLITRTRLKLESYYKYPVKDFIDYSSDHGIPYYKGKMFKMGNTCFGNNNDYKYIDAPCQSVVQRGLRELYNIHLNVRWLGKNYECEGRNGSDVIIFNYLESVGDIHSTYEGALEEGILESLKIITQ